MVLLEGCRVCDGFLELCKGCGFLFYFASVILLFFVNFFVFFLEKVVCMSEFKVVGVTPRLEGRHVITVVCP